VYNNFKYCSQKCLDYYLYENKDATLRYQEKARLANENKHPQLEEKAKHLLALVSADYQYLFEDPSLHLVFVDTENDGKKWTLNKCREVSFYSARLAQWLFYDVDMNGDHEAQMEDCFMKLLQMFP
jgi:hypothetical protein